jgi:hypothetical protein
MNIMLKIKANIPRTMKLKTGKSLKNRLFSGT